MPYLTRQELHRVLQSLIEGERNQNRRPGSLGATDALKRPWPESLAMGEDGAPALGCDSIERLWLAGAVNEMFCLYDSRTEDGLLTAASFGDWLDIVDRGWNSQGTRITFSTSGSSGVPKRCTHAMADLEREVSYLAKRFSGMLRIIALAPAHHIYGFLFTALLPAHAGIAVVDAGTLSAGALTELLQEGDLIVSTPLRWEWLLRSLGTWPKGVHGICSTAPCPEWLKQQLIQNGLASFTEVYGSTETAGVGLRTYPAPRYTLMPFWAWEGPSNTASRLRDDAGRTVTLQDALEIAPDGTFTVQARKDGAVQVGGVNVFPGRLEASLRSIPGVADAVIRLTTGSSPQRLKAFVVPGDGVAEATLRPELEFWSNTLSTPERVCSFTFGPELPKNAMGKAADWLVE